MISHIRSDNSESVKRLVSMGFVPGRKVYVDTILSNTGPRIVKINETSVALDYELASFVFVDIAC